jgi:hypothetical protein
VKAVAGTLAGLALLIAAPAASARDCTSSDRGSAFAVSVRAGKGSLRTVQLFPRQNGDRAGKDFTVTVARSQHSTFTRRYHYLETRRQIRFRLRKGERVNVTARYTEDRTFQRTVVTGEVIVDHLPLSAQVVTALSEQGIDVTGLVADTPLQTAIPTTRYDTVPDSCVRTISTSARRR